MFYFLKICSSSHIIYLFSNISVLHKMITDGLTNDEMYELNLVIAGTINQLVVHHLLTILIIDLIAKFWTLIPVSQMLFSGLFPPLWQYTEYISVVDQENI